MSDTASDSIRLSEHRALNEFLSAERAAVIALPVPGGDIHAATLMFVHLDDPLRLIFITGRDTEKGRALSHGAVLRGACVVGTRPQTPFTVQMRGFFRLIDHDYDSDSIRRYYDKRGNRNDDIDDPANVLLYFEPAWARCTDYAEADKQFYLDV